MASTGSVFSQTLQSITDEKLIELSKKRDVFETQKASVLEEAQKASDDQFQLRILLDGVKKCFLIKTLKSGQLLMGNTVNSALEMHLVNIHRFLGQAQYDPSVSKKLMGEWKKLLVQQLDMQSAKYAYASLYGQLVTEWLSSEKESAIALDSDAKMTDGFEEVDKKEKLQSRLLWEDAVFVPHETSIHDVEEYLRYLLSNAKDRQQASKAFKELRSSVDLFEAELSMPNQFNQFSLRWTIKGLLASDLLANEERAVLKDFLTNDIILNEVADVLNLRMAALETWSWGDGIQVEQRRRLNGTYLIYMHEQLLQAIFLQYLGIKWSVFFKQAFTRFAKSDGAWTSSSAEISKLDKRRREYFLGPQDKGGSIQVRRRQLYRARYLVSQLLHTPDQQTEVDEGDEEADYGRMQVQQAPQAPVQSFSMSVNPGPAARRGGHAKMASTTATKRARRVAMDNHGEEDDDENAPGDRLSNPMEAKQALLHLLSTEILINKHLYGDFTCCRADFEQWNTRLPHSSVIAVLHFFGISTKWLTFFRTFMEAPLAFSGEEPRLRKRGIPSSHALSDVLGEVVLFCADFAVNQGTNGKHLYRLYDDFWFWSSDHQTCVTAWGTMQRFAKVMGVTINDRKAGTVRISQSGTPGKIDASLPKGEIRWGFLYLDPKSGRFLIDSKMVDAHVKELQHQLTDKTSIFAWTKAWNTYANTFFTTNFGRPAYCYGRDHIDMILATLERAQRTIFARDDHTSVVESIKTRLAERFGVEDVPDGYVFFPIELGGLEVLSPFIGLLQIRDAVPAKPQNLLDEFTEAEKEAYRNAKMAFDKGEGWRYSRDEPDWRPDDPDTFMTFEEFTRYREEYGTDYSKDLQWVFNELMKKPEDQAINASAEAMTALNHLHQSSSGVMNAAGINGNWHSMTSYWKWVAEIYGREIIGKFGGLSIVDAGLLPIGMVSLFRSGRVKWTD